jgi:WD40 repeat protein
VEGPPNAEQDMLPLFGSRTWDSDSGDEAPNRLLGDAARRMQVTVPVAVAPRSVVPTELQLSVPAHDGGAFALAFNRAGTRMASSGADKTVKVWDPNTGQLINTLQVRLGSLLCGGLHPEWVHGQDVTAWCPHPYATGDWVDWRVLAAVSVAETLDKLCLALSEGCRIEWCACDGQQRIRPEPLCQPHLAPCVCGASHH